MGKREGISRLSAEYADKHREACRLNSEFEELSTAQGLASDLKRRQQDLINLELEMRSLRCQVLEEYHAQLPFFSRFKTPRYWQIVCPIKLDYPACSSNPWYEHISRDWYESEEQAIIGAYQYLKLNTNPSYRIKIGPLEKMVKILVREAGVSPEFALGNLTRPKVAALPAPAAS